MNTASAITNWPNSRSLLSSFIAAVSLHQFTYQILGRGGDYIPQCGCPLLVKNMFHHDIGDEEDGKWRIFPIWVVRNPNVLIDKIPKHHGQVFVVFEQCHISLVKFSRVFLIK